MRGDPLRVALVYDDSLDRRGGIPQYLATLGQALSARGHEVSLLVGESRTQTIGGCEVHSLARNVGVRFNGSSLSMPVLPRPRRMAAVLRQARPDVVHVQVPYSPVMAGLLMSRLSRATALVGTFHVASEKLLPRLGASALAWATAPGLRRFDEVLSVSGHAARFAERQYGLALTTVVPNMIDLRAGAAPVASASAAPTVVCVGALVPRKGQRELVEAFAQVHRRMPAARLVLAGEGPMRAALQRVVSRHGLERVVELLGDVSERRKAELLAEADVACFPSRYGESFGIVLLEAMRADGPAILAGDNLGYRQVLGSVPGSLCAPRPDALATRLVELLGDTGGRQRLARAQNALLGRYDAEQVSQEVEAAYRRALQTRRGQSYAAA